MHAFEQLLFLISCEQHAYKLRDYLTCLDVPAGKTFSLDLSDLLWLRRNLFFINRDHHMADLTMEEIRVCHMFAASSPEFEQIIGRTR